MITTQLGHSRKHIMTARDAKTILKTERLTLREFVAEDAADMEAVLCDRDVMLYSMGTLKPSEVSIWIERTIKSYSENTIGNWAMVENESGTVMGYCGLTYSKDYPEHGIELNYRLAKPWWGKGLATEIATAVIDYARQNKLSDRLFAVVDPNNEASLNVVRKLGLAFENELWIEEYDYPDYLFALYFDG